MTTSEQTIGIAGAGTMGLGIAELAMLHGDTVLIFDTESAAVKGAAERIRKALDRRVDKGSLSAAERDEAMKRFRIVGGLDELHSCDFVFEAVLEDASIKQALFHTLGAVTRKECLLASNTSSLSITALGAASGVESRVCGLHFFNPAPAMPLVEVVPGLRSDDTLVTAGERLVQRWGKTTIRTKDTPGFLVNRVARPFYGEALRILEEGWADAATIDQALRVVGGFRMGPFELMDLIGLDVNFAVTSSVFEQTFFEARYRPSLLQQRMVEAGLLGRKSGQGFFDYRPHQQKPSPVEDAALSVKIVDRVLAMMINEAVFAVQLQIATAEDIEIAMTKGTNYPKGLLAWGRSLGWHTVLQRLEALYLQSSDDRYRPAPLLRELASGTKSLLTSKK